MRAACARVGGICGRGQSGTVKNGGVKNSGVDNSAPCGRGWTMQDWSAVTKAVYKITSLENDSLYIQSELRIIVISVLQSGHVPTLMHHLHARLAETLMSTGDYRPNRIYTVDQTITTCLEHILTHLTTPALSTPALSTPATWCRIVHSCNVHPCHIVLICPLLQSPSLQHGAELSTPALSTPANSAFPSHSVARCPPAATQRMNC